MHRYRVNWWTDALQDAKAKDELLQPLIASKFPTDQQGAEPESFRDYFVGVDVTFAHGVKTPDEIFFDRRVVVQVQSNTLWRTWKDGLLSQEDLRNVPFFMCGGGVRMAYYEQLEGRLAEMRGCTWLRAERWAMAVPDDLEAEGISQDDYDRLSVAYGLSRLEVGKIVKALPMPKLMDAPTESWRENYIDKDQI